MNEKKTKPEKSITAIDLDETALPPPTPEMEQERRLAIFDILEENLFTIEISEGMGTRRNGPFSLLIKLTGNRLLLSLKEPVGGDKIFDFMLSLNPFKKIIQDYFQICESYFDAVKSLPSAKIEAIDMARRAIHDEGANILLERLNNKIRTNHTTARRLFTLICVLNVRD